MQYCTKILSFTHIAAIAATGILAGIFLHILMLLNTGDNVVHVMKRLQDAALYLTAGIAIYGLMILLLIICRFRMLQKTAADAAVFGNKRQAQINSIKDAVLKLQQEYVKADKIHSAGCRFIAMMSHDLRTPMNAILGYSMLIEKDSADQKKVNHYARQIHTSGQILMELINDVLDMNCIENGNIKLIENEFSLLSALNEVQASIEPQSAEKNQTFCLCINNPEDIDMVTGDRRRLCQILRNVLSNAVKYTSAGGYIEMSVDLMAVRGQNAQMMCQIKDNGCGMSEEFLRGVFRPFEREYNDDNADVPGTGLGMCIARSFSELMGGELSAESEPGVGTLVTIRIPLKAAEKQNMNIVSADLWDNSVLRGLCFLAAEDNELNAEILYEVLKSLGAECVIAEDGRTAVEIFEKSDPGRFDIILMDVHMPVMDGYRAAVSIRCSGHPDAKEIKIIAMTADAYADDVKKAFAYGMDAHVAKPLNLESFINTVASLGLKRK